jgi:hypothetical protein
MLAYHLSAYVLCIRTRRTRFAYLNDYGGARSHITHRSCELRYVMRMLLESSSIHAMSSTLADDIFVYVSFSLMVVITTFTIYALARILEWSSNKPLPRVLQSSAFSVLLVSLVAATAMLLLLGVDLIQVFGKLGGPIVSIVVAPDHAPVVFVGLAGAIMLIVFQWLRAG